MDIAGTYNEQQDACWNLDAFSKIDNLKFLRINEIDHVLMHLPDDLRVLDWTHFPLISLPSTFQLYEIVQLYLRRSRIEQLWIGIKVSMLLSILIQLWF